MAKRYPKELRERAVRVALERLDDQNTPYQVAADLAPKLGVRKEAYAGGLFRLKLMVETVLV